MSDSVASGASRRKRKQRLKERLKPSIVQKASPKQASTTTSDRTPTGQPLAVTPEAVRSVYAGFYHRHIYLIQFRESAPWTRKRLRWDGGVYRGKPYEPIWPTIAQFIRRRGYPLYSWVRWCFGRASRTPPEPDRLFWDYNAEAFWKEFHDSVTRLERRLAFEVDQFERFRFMSGDFGEGAKEVDKHAPFPAMGGAKREVNNPELCPSTALAMARSSDLFVPYAIRRYAPNELFEMDFRPAMRQFLEHPDAYSIAWRKALPPNFAVLAMWYWAESWQVDPLAFVPHKVSDDKKQ